MLRKSFRFLTILLILGIVLSACGSAATPTTAAQNPTTPPQEPTQASSQEPVNIGALLPQSEPGAAQAGQLILRGIELGAVYVNTVMGGSVDGRPVQIDAA